MQNEPNQWIVAEEKFHNWIDDPKNYPVDEFANLRKSIHFYFREKYHDLLKPIADQAFKKLSLQELLEKEKQSEEKYYAPKVYKEVEEEIYEDRRPLFKRSRISEKPKNTILERFKNNERDTIYDFYENQFSKVAWLILKNNGSIEDAKDIFQDALVILLEKIHWEKIVDDYSLGTFLYSICRNLWFEHLRRQKKEKEFVDLKQYYSKNISIEYSGEKPDNFELARNAIELLGNPCKSLLELYYYKNLSWEKIAAKLGYANAASARNQKYKCLERIREKLDFV